ncbi:hypothetical protein DFH29DRAFT_876626 [Suillus ampliporus]|nr:hypothetical protein DFH29DRAFT_876626 [Suillus ampliporus]
MTIDRAVRKPRRSLNKGPLGSPALLGHSELFWVLIPQWRPVALVKVKAYANGIRQEQQGVRQERLAARNAPRAPPANYQKRQTSSCSREEPGQTNWRIRVLFLVSWDEDNVVVRITAALSVLLYIGGVTLWMLFREFNFGLWIFATLQLWDLLGPYLAVAPHNSLVSSKHLYSLYLASNNS